MTSAKESLKAIYQWDRSMEIAMTTTYETQNVARTRQRLPATKGMALKKRNSPTNINARETIVVAMIIGKGDCPVLNPGLQVRRLLNSLSLLISLIVIGALYFSPVEASAVTQKEKGRGDLSMVEARKIAISEFEKQTSGRYKKFTCALAKNDATQWAFFFSDYMESPAPGGADLMVFVNKKTGAVTSLFGK